MPDYSYRAPSSSASSSASETYEYDGMDDLVRKRDEAAQTAAQKTAALYKGDIAGSLAANTRIRGLLNAIAAYEAGALPLSRVRSRSGSSSMDYSGPQVGVRENEPAYSMSGKPKPKDDE